MNLEPITKAVVKIAGKRALTLQAHSPEILVGAGIIGLIGSTVLACRATLQVEDIIAHHRDVVEGINEVAEYHATNICEEKFDEKDRKRALTITYVHTGLNFVKLYGPPIVLGTASVMCILSGHNILRKRNLAVMAAYKVLDDGFKSYRKRVVDEFGEEKDYMLRHGLKAETIVEQEAGPDGKVKNVKKQQLATTDPNGTSIYAKFFDDSSHNWSPTPEYNLMFLRAQQNYYNDMLKARGHVFLNEIYDALGIDRTQAGAVVGWKLGSGDDFIDFGLFEGDTQRSRAFVNGREQNILLDFNVDGVIFDTL